MCIRDSTEAAYNGRTDSVKALLEAGANVNTQDKDGRTALMWATEDKYPDTSNTTARTVSPFR